MDASLGLLYNVISIVLAASVLGDPLLPDLGYDDSFQPGFRL